MVVLTHCADFARVVHRHLLGDDEDLFEVRVDSDQFCNTVPCGGGRQVHDAAIEAVAGIETLAHIVVDGDVADRSLQDLAASAGRGAEHDVAARIGVPDRGHLTRFPAENVENADPILVRRDLREGADADVVLEISDSRASHGRDPCAWNNGSSGLRPPARRCCRDAWRAVRARLISSMHPPRGRRR